MARETIFVVQAFTQDDDGRLVADTPVPARNELDAKDRALRMKGTKAGVIAFSRTGDISIGEYGDAVILASYGDIPDENAQD